MGSNFKGERLTHAAFADDMMLVANSWLSRKRMVASLREALQRRDLFLHPSKCKAQTNNASFAKRGNIQIADSSAIEVLPHGDPLRLFGTDAAVENTTTPEIPKRCRVADEAFALEQEGVDLQVVLALG